MVTLWWSWSLQQSCILVFCSRIDGCWHHADSLYVSASFCFFPKLNMIFILHIYQAATYENQRPYPVSLGIVGKINSNESSVYVVFLQTKKLESADDAKLETFYISKIIIPLKKPTRWLTGYIQRLSSS